jgi:hypothetical protein
MLYTKERKVMASKRTEQVKPHLAVPRDEARQRMFAQLEKAKTLPAGASINENQAAKLWYEFTAELLRQLFTTNEVTDEFTGRSSFIYDDISVKRYLDSLTSIYQRLELYPEEHSLIATSNPIDPVSNIEKLITKFHTITRQLRKRYDDRPTLDVNDEYDVQDLFHALLKLFFDDIRPEEWTPSYAGGSSRMDFLLKSEKIVIETKKTRAKLGAKEIGEQLATDILRYRSHPDCRTLICFVYDPEERILNPRGLERDLSQPMGEMQVKTYVVQK